MARLGALVLAVLSAHGIGAVHFGLPKAQAVSQLTAVLGPPSRRFVNSGCGSRYTEVAFGHLYAEFRAGRFSGYRYMEDGWIRTHYGEKIVRSDLPRLETARRVTLGSTLRELRAAYRLHVVGTDRWGSPDGLVFYDDAGRIDEIKTGTCGDF